MQFLASRGEGRLALLLVSWLVRSMQKDWVKVGFGLYEESELEHTDLFGKHEAA